MADDSDFEEDTKFKPFGLEELPSIAHESFHQHATHLHEVMDRHTAVLVEAGKLPETQSIDGETLTDAIGNLPLP